MAYPVTSEWFSPELLADPYPYYKKLRESDPVHFDPLRQSWLIARWHDVDRVLRDSTTFSAEQGPGTPVNMLVADPPRHTRLRKLVSKAFTPRRVELLRPRIQGIVDELLDEAAGRPEMEAIADFAYPLPITVIADLLGVEIEHRAMFRAESQRIAMALGPTADPHTSLRANEGRSHLMEYFDDLIARRKAQPQDDLVSALIQAEERGDELNHVELKAMMLLLLVGGHETTVNLIGNGLVALLRHPGELQLLRDDPSVARTAVDELLRYDSPVQYSGRIATTDVELSGKTIRAGERVRMLLASANHDDEVFHEPAVLDLRRDPCPHMSFAIGVHYCLGAELARVEGEIALASFVRRFPDVRLPDLPLRWRPAPVMRGLEELPLLI